MSQITVDEALSELQALVAARFPEATFEVVWGEDPIGPRLRATVDLEDTEPVIDAVMDRLLEFIEDPELPYIIVQGVPTPERQARMREHEDRIRAALRGQKLAPTGD